LAEDLLAVDDFAARDLFALELLAVDEAPAVSALALEAVRDPTRSGASRSRSAAKASTPTVRPVARIDRVLVRVATCSPRSATDRTALVADRVTRSAAKRMTFRFPLTASAAA
jgi:hypothetical protein